MRQGNLKKFVDRANEIHHNRYDYKWVLENEPKTVKSKIIVNCPIHGDFETTFDTHVNKGSGCPKCSGVHKKTTEEFIQECKVANKDKEYDYSKVVYKNNKDKVTVICHNVDMYGKEHGEFMIRAAHLLNGHGCPKCAKRYISTDDWIYMAKKTHGDKYDYSKVVYKNNHTPVNIICPEHGEFKQVPYVHINGGGCPKCNGGVRFSKKEFIEKANDLHNGIYGYEKFIYVNARTPGIITCPIHGDFKQSPYLHLRGAGCPMCKSSRLEKIVASKLSKANIIFDTNIVVGGELGKQSFDFYIPSKDLYVECQGEQHYLPVKFSPQMSDKDANDALIKRQKLDMEKYEWCVKNGHRIVYLSCPSQFRLNDNFDVFSGFYEGKIVFVDADALLKYINEIGKEEKNNTPLENFKGDFVKEFKGASSGGNRIKYKNFVVYLNPLVEVDKHYLNELKRINERRGYNVIHIFEDEYMYRKDIVLSKLKHIMDNESENARKIPGRKCDITPITKDAAKEFLEHNHIQGFTNSTTYIGAFYNGVLVACMTFLNEGNDDWNLTRFATINGYICQGIGGKLFKWFVRNYNPKCIKSFADRRWTTNPDDNLYVKLGFKLAVRTAPDYRYYKRGETKERIHKFNFRKQTLHKKYGLPLSMTETEMARKLGYDRIWDCGLFKYVWKKMDE